MTPTVRDWALQTLGLLIGFVPAILLTFAFPIGVAVYALIAVGFIYSRTRALAYGAVCSILILPGLGIGLWLLL
jgi:hypothetical protein